MDDCLVCKVEFVPYRVTSTKCRIDTVISPDDGHTVARNMQRKELNVLRKIVHQFGRINKIVLYVCKLYIYIYICFCCNICSASCVLE